MDTTVVGLYIHGDRSPGREATEPVPMLSLPRVDAVEGRGLQQDRRYFRPVLEGRDRKRQVSLIDEGTIARLEVRFGRIERRFIKSQIVLAGDVFLPGMIGARLAFEGGATLEIAIERDPCFQMDLIKPGLREAMMDGRQGALARVLVSGIVEVGQPVTILPVEDDVRVMATGR